jgi:EAL domain-containing protein (putative c-di-GMP-specific phosphodiesterase class I)/FixJ family two-component response regulator
MNRGGYLMKFREGQFQPTSSYPNVLLVDDEDALLASVRRILRKQCSLKTCSDPHEAIRLLRQSPDSFDIIISDLRMPGIDGVEFLTIAREIAPEVPRVLLSGSLSENALKEAINKAGISRVIVKPVPPEVMLSTVQGLTTGQGDASRPSRQMALRVQDALKTDHTVFFQPRVNADDFAVAGQEALSRFPGLQQTFTVEEIISGAEDHPVIGDLTFKVLGFIDQHHDVIAKQYGNHPISVNLSPNSISDINFVNALIDFLRAHPGLPLLEFEVTEQSNMAFTAEFQDNLPRLLSAGYKVFLDDFGAGNNSIALLRRGHFSGLKLDKSLIARLDDHNTIDSSFVEWVTQAAHQLGMSVIAEGVETLDSATFLQHIGVDQLQGYYFGRPGALLLEGSDIQKDPGATFSR